MRAVDAIFSENWRDLEQVIESRKVPGNTSMNKYRIDVAMRAAAWVGSAKTVENTLRIVTTDPEYVGETDLMRTATIYKLKDLWGKCEINTGVMRWLYKNCPPASLELTSLELDRLAREASLAVIKTLFHLQYDFSEWALAEAASRDGLSKVQFLYKHRRVLKWTPAALSRAIDAAAANGWIDVLRFLHEECEFAPCSTSAMDIAAGRGYLDVVTYLHVNRSEGCTTDAMDDAAKSGHMDVVRFLHENRSEGCTTDALDCATAQEHHAIVHFLHNSRSEGCTVFAMDEAASGGDLGMVQFLHDNRHEGCTTRAMDGAAAGGHLAVVEFLHKHRHEGCTTDAMDRAAAGTHVDVVRFLHEHRMEGCTAAAVDSAAGNGDMPTLQFLAEQRSEGCTARALHPSRTRVETGSPTNADAVTARWCLVEARALLAANGRTHVLAELDEIIAATANPLAVAVACVQHVHNALEQPPHEPAQNSEGLGITEDRHGSKLGVFATLAFMPPSSCHSWRFTFESVSAPRSEFPSSSSSSSSSSTSPVVSEMDPVLSGSLCFLVLAVVMYVKFIREHPWGDDEGGIIGQRKASSPVEPDAVPFLHPQSPAAGVAHKLKLKQQLQREQQQGMQANAPLQKAYAPGGGGGGGALLLPAGQHYPGFLNKQPMRRRTHSVSAAAAVAVGGGGTSVQASAADPSGAGDSGGSAAMDQQQLPTTIFEGHNQDADRHRRGGGHPHQHPHQHHHHHPHLHQRYPPSSGRGQHRINFDNIDFDSDCDLDFLAPGERAGSAAGDGDSLESVPFEDHDDSGFFDLESSVRPPPPHIGGCDSDLDADLDGNFPVHSPTRRVSVGASEGELLLPFRSSDLGLDGSSTPPKADAKNPIERQFVRAVAQPAQMQLEVARKARIPLFLHSPMYVKTSTPPIVDDVLAAARPPRLDHFGGAELPEGIANEAGEFVHDAPAAVAAGDAAGVGAGVVGAGVVAGRPPGGMTPRRRDKLPASAGGANASLHIDFSELKVAELIGQGAFGTVHRASWRGTTVAVKILVCQYLTVDILEEFETEVHIMSILRHPNICLLMGACLDPPTRCLVIEYLPRGSLWNVLRQDNDIDYAKQTSQIQAALGVLNNNLRPTIPVGCPPLLQQLMTLCWGSKPEERPTFEAILDLLRRHAADEFVPMNR
ncbi:hypothetical protein PybrP1_013130 [[Pythium] brassicae (nom. inval.)]|nr:hypothetical protein PybrP1_013130 [[Pythium] brassicae (nom. inval.)]